MLQRDQVVLAHQIGFGDEDLIGKAHLSASLLAVIELLGRVFGVHQGQDGVEQITLGNLVVHEKGLRHRSRIGQAGGLNDNTVKLNLAFPAFLGQIGERGAQVFADGAAHAAIAHLNNLLLALQEQDVVVNIFFAELIFNDRNLLPMGFRQHAFEQGGFSGTQKTSQDSGRNQHKFAFNNVQNTLDGSKTPEINTASSRWRGPRVFSAPRPPHLSFEHNISV